MVENKPDNMPSSILDGINTRKRAAGKKAVPSDEVLQQVHEKVDPYGGKPGLPDERGAAAKSEEKTEPKARQQRSPKKPQQSKAKPKKALSERLNTRVDEEEFAQLVAIADEKKWNLPQLQRYILQGWLKEGKQRYL